MKKLLFGLLSTITVGTSALAISSCGTESFDDKVVLKGFHGNFGEIDDKSQGNDSFAPSLIHLVEHDGTDSSIETKSILAEATPPEMKTDSAVIYVQGGPVDTNPIGFAFARNPHGVPNMLAEFASQGEFGSRVFALKQRQADDTYPKTIMPINVGANVITQYVYGFLNKLKGLTTSSDGSTGPTSDQIDSITASIKEMGDQNEKLQGNYSADIASIKSKLLTIAPSDLATQDKYTSIDAKTKTGTDDAILTKYSKWLLDQNAERLHQSVKILEESGFKKIFIVGTSYGMEIIMDYFSTHKTDISTDSNIKKIIAGNNYIDSPEEIQKNYLEGFYSKYEYNLHLQKPTGSNGTITKDWSAGFEDAFYLKNGQLNSWASEIKKNIGVSDTAKWYDNTIQEVAQDYKKTVDALTKLKNGYSSIQNWSSSLDVEAANKKLSLAFSIDDDRMKMPTQSELDNLKSKGITYSILVNGHLSALIGDTILSAFILDYKPAQNEKSYFSIDGKINNIFKKYIYEKFPNANPGLYITANDILVNSRRYHSTYSEVIDNIAKLFPLDKFPKRDEILNELKEIISYNI